MSDKTFFDLQNGILSLSKKRRALYPVHRFCVQNHFFRQPEFEVSRNHPPLQCDQNKNGKKEIFQNQLARNRTFSPPEFPDRLENKNCDETKKKDAV